VSAHLLLFNVQLSEFKARPGDSASIYNAFLELKNTWKEFKSNASLSLKEGRDYEIIEMGFSHTQKRIDKLISKFPLRSPQSLQGRCMQCKIRNVYVDPFNGRRHNYCGLTCAEKAKALPY
jgi:hypothetical protein